MAAHAFCSVVDVSASCISSGMQQKVAIVGTGAFAQGLASLIIRSGATSGYSVVLSSRKVQPGHCEIFPGLEETPVCHLKETLSQADLQMVILAMPAAGLPQFVTSYGHMLAGKVVVDVTNPMVSDYAKLTRVPSTPASCTSSISPLDVERALEDSAAGCCRQQDAAKAGGLDQLQQAPSSKFDTIGALQCSLLAVYCPASLCHCREAFNNMSAYALLHGDPLTEHMKSVAASNSMAAAEAVAALGRAMGLEMLVVPSLAYAATLEARQHSLLPAWQWPWWLMVATWLLAHTFCLLHFCYFGGMQWQHVTLWVTNKSMGWVALWGLLYTYLPGVLVSFWQLLSRRPAVRLPGWIKAWMDGRKQLGLLSFADGMLHMLMSVCLRMPSYYNRMFEPTDITEVSQLPAAHLAQLGQHHNITHHGGNYTLGLSADAAAVTMRKAVTLQSRLTAIGETATLMGVLSCALLCMVALTSLPGVTVKLNWREWRVLQARIGWLAFVAATVHTLMLGAPWWAAARSEWPRMIPADTLLCVAPVVLLLLLLLLKSFISLPPGSWILGRVHSGRWARRDDAAGSFSRTAAFAVKH